MTEEAMQAAVDLERRTVCRGTKPGEVSRGAFDASPLEARIKMAGDVAAWSDMCMDAL